MTTLPTDVGVERARVDTRAFFERLRDRKAWILPARGDPRWIFVVVHACYVLLGHMLLSFNRSPGQIMAALVTCMLLEVIYTYVSTRMFIVPISGIISGLGLGLLFTAPGNLWLMLLASWLTITGKFVVTWRGHHIYNPTNLAMVILLVATGGTVAVAPAYQWGGSWQIVVFVFILGCIIAWRARKLPLVLAFATTWVLGALLRAQVSHMPAEITLYAQLSGGAFWLFLFFMITDPKTSPPSVRGMIAFGIAVGVVDMWLQLQTAVFSVFYALFIVCTARALWWISQDARKALSARVAAAPVGS
jgi:Na+-translocating ferredoxin:NAD+ oxidoreductase RnfD subunit